MATVTIKAEPPDLCAHCYEESDILLPSGPNEDALCYHCAYAWWHRTTTIPEPEFEGPELLNPTNINQERQNRPTLIAQDLLDLAGVPPHLTYEVLLRRGVFKWFAVRRYLIAFKCGLKNAITALQIDLRGRNAVGLRRTHFSSYLRGYLKALEFIRTDLRGMCNQPRWIAPDNDRLAVQWLYWRTRQDLYDSSQWESLGSAESPTKEQDK